MKSKVVTTAEAEEIERRASRTSPYWVEYEVRRLLRDRGVVMAIVGDFLNKDSYTKYDKMEEDFCAYCTEYYAFNKHGDYIERHKGDCVVLKARRLIEAMEE